MRALAKIFLLATLVLSCTLSAFPREASWNELITEVLKLYHVGRYSEAAQAAEEALAVAENSFGSSHPNVVESLNILAILYYCQGEYGKAELLFERVLTILERTLGTSHPNVGACFNNLAAIYMEQGKYAEAEGFFKRALAIREKALGKDHPDVASVLENMRECYKMPEMAKRIRNQMPPVEGEEQPAIPETVERKGMEEKLSEEGTMEHEKPTVSKPPESSMMIPERELDKKVFTSGEKELLEEEREVKVAEVEGKKVRKPQVVKVEEPKDRAIPQGKLPRGVYTVHIASFRDKGNADRVVKELDEKGYKAFVEKATIPQKGTWYRVSVGRFPSRREALVFVQGLKKKGISYSFVRKLKEVK